MKIKEPNSRENIMDDKEVIGNETVDTPVEKTAEELMDEFNAEQAEKFLNKKFVKPKEVFFYKVMTYDETIDELQITFPTTTQRVKLKEILVNPDGKLIFSFTELILKLKEYNLIRVKGKLKFDIEEYPESELQKVASIIFSCLA